MIDLSLYVGKKVTVTLRNGEIWKGVTVSHDEECEYPYVVGDDIGEDSFYQDGQCYSYPSDFDIVSVIPYETNLCNEIPMPEPEPETTRNIDLSQFVEKRVTATLRSGRVVTDVVISNPASLDFPFLLGSEAYTQSGCFFDDGEDMYDIVSIKLYEKPDMTPEIDLTQFVGKKVKAKLRGGITVTDRVLHGRTKEYPFTLNGYSYTANGQHYEDKETPRDIISLFELIEVSKAQPAGGEAVYVARNLDGKFLFAAPALKTLQDYVRQNYPADAHLDINTTTEYLTNG